MNTIKLPGLIDAHVHFRDPGQTEKEDFLTGTTAALFGGITTVLDMPNNKIPIVSLALLKEKIKNAKRKIVCDVGFYAGTLGEDTDQLSLMEPYVFGLKLYFNHTTGNFIIDKKSGKELFLSWKSNKPILVHAEEDILPAILKLVEETGRRVHICHVSNKEQLRLIIGAKEKKLPVTCGVTSHHLFLNENDLPVLQSFGLMKPRLGSKTDQNFLWENLSYIDILESDHAPHTVSEKNTASPPFGVPGVETTLPLLLTSVAEKRLSLKRLVELCFENPKNIFSIETNTHTWIEIDPREEYSIDNKNLKTKCGWIPFHGWRVKGKLKKVVMRGVTVIENDRLLINPGFGKFICPKNK